MQTAHGRVKRFIAGKSLARERDFPLEEARFFAGAMKSPGPERLRR